MKKRRNISIIIVIIVSLALIIGISIKLLDNTGKINQGNYRLNDMVVTSKIEAIESKSAKETTTSTDTTATNTDTTTANAEKTNINKLNFDLSQKNTIDLLITKDIEAKEVYINNVSLSEPSKKGEIVLSINGENQTIDSSKKDITLKEKDDQYYLEIKIDNNNFVKEAKIPEGTNKISLDGTILDILNIKLSDIALELIFDLNIVDSSGKNNVCKLKFKMPTEALITEGISVTREDKTNYIFSLRENNN